MKTCNLIILVLISMTSIHAIDFSKEDPKVDEEIQIQLTEPSDQVIIAYRPNSGVTITDTLKSASAITSYNWQPLYPGVVMVSTSTESANISVRFKSLSVSGLIVMLLAFSILFGGVFLSFRLLFSESGHEGIDLSERVDT